MKKKYSYTTQRQVRAAFKDYLTSCDRDMTSCDVRCAFVDFVDTCQKDGIISAALADRVTLG